jgi:hypothetical protein
MLPLSPLAQLVVQSSLDRLAHSALPDAPQLPPRRRSKLRTAVSRNVRRRPNV